jgi:hypothetical protein
MCLALFRAEWRDSAAQKNGRNGYEQFGVDIYGKNHTQDAGYWGVQCKCKNNIYGAKLTKAEIDNELHKVDTFEPSRLPTIFFEYAGRKPIKGWAPLLT